jgi:hypothetical protein
MFLSLPNNPMFKTNTTRVFIFIQRQKNVSYSHVIIVGIKDLIGQGHVVLSCALPHMPCPSRTISKPSRFPWLWLDFFFFFFFQICLGLGCTCIRHGSMRLLVIRSSSWCACLGQRFFVISILEYRV